MANAIAIVDDEHWHKLRSENVGASEVSALFGASPYTTRFTLYHEKAGKIARPDFDSERMFWGNLLEPVIAQGIAEKQGWKVRKVRRYLTHRSIKGMGASLDYEIIGHTDGMGCLEIKNVSIEAFYKGWAKNEDGSFEAPIHIELQLQHQMSVSGYPWGAIGFLVGGNQAHVVIRKRHEPTITKLETAVSDFWESIAKGEIPSIEEAGDLAAMIQLFEGVATVNVDSIAFDKLVSDLLDAKSALKAAEEKEGMCKALMIQALDMHKAEIALTNGYKVSYKEQSRKETVQRASKFRVLRVSEIKEKGGK